MERKITMPKVILFDLDDTISSFDSVCAPAWMKCCLEFVESHQPTFTQEELLNSINYTRAWYWADPDRHKKGRENLREARREVVRYALEELGIQREELVIELADHYTELQDAMIGLLPGSKEALELIKQRGIRMAVITNGASSVQREKLLRFGITGYFEKLFIDEEVGYSKPNKEIFDFALSQMNVTAEEAWMVGDNLVWDIFGAQQLGIYAVWNDYKKKGLPLNSGILPDRIVNSIYEMAKILS